MRWKQNIFWIADKTRQCNKSSHVKMDSLQRCQVLTFPRGHWDFRFCGFGNFLNRFFGFGVSDFLLGDAVWCFYGFYSENTRVNDAHINYEKKKTKQNNPPSLMISRGLYRKAITYKPKKFIGHCEGLLSGSRSQSWSRDKAKKWKQKAVSLKCAGFHNQSPSTN